VTSPGSAELYRALRASDKVQTAVTPIRDIVAHLDDLLRPQAFSDYAPNGLQVPGPDDVTTVVTGVSAHAELLRRAADAGAGLVLVHHGLFWRGQPLEVTAVMHARLKLLYDNEMALAAYHLPLDAHPEHGNNVLLAEAVGLQDLQPLGDLGVQGTLPGDGLEASAFAARVRDAVGGREPLHVAGGPERVRTAGIVTGAATDHVNDALAAGLDAFVTGEPAERAFGTALDGGIHFLAAGHHATETFGVRRLGDLLAERFGIRHVFIDVPNPI
jgi:dinuclear metal center YbgI/SA1388 family protein